MNNFFLVLFLLSTVLFLLGLVKPSLVVRWGSKRNRKTSVLVYGIAVVFFFIAFGTTTPQDAALPSPNKVVSPDAKITHNKTNANTTSTADKNPTTIPSASANLVPVVVAKETDGDTFHVTMQNGKDETVRMLLIDTPEDVKPGTPVEPFSLEAAKYCATRMPIGKHIYLEEGNPGYTRDKYGRLLAFAYITPTDMYNEDVVKIGLARVAYIYPPNTQHLSVLEADQSYAKSRQIGIWSIPGYVTDYGYNMAAVGSASKSTTSPSSGSAIQVVSSNLSMTRGDQASITVHVGTGVDGSIEVDYKSGPSHASGLESQTADANGNITWTWYVGTKTIPGNWSVVISAGSKSITRMLTVK